MRHVTAPCTEAHMPDCKKDFGRTQGLSVLDYPSVPKAFVGIVRALCRDDFRDNLRINPF